MVVVHPALAADGDEVATRAVLARPRVCRGSLFDVQAQPPLRDAQVGVHISRPVRLDLAGAQHHVQALWKPSLDRRDLPCVPGEL
jgi:hypothetical protein